MISYRTYRSFRYRVDVVLNLTMCPVPVSMLYRYRYQLLYRYRYQLLYRYRYQLLYRYRYQLRYRRPYRYAKVPVMISYRTYRVSGSGLMLYRTCRSAQYYQCCEVSGTGLMYQTYRSVRYRYRCCTDTGTNSGTDVHTGTGSTSIDVVPNLPKCPVRVLRSYRTCRSARKHYMMLHRTHRSVR